MPKLLILAPCDNVLISGNVDTVSLIVVMTTVMFPKPPENVPLGAVAPMRWFVFTNWAISKEDDGKSFDQRIRMVQNEQTYFDSVQQFELASDKIHHRMIAALYVFPLVAEGLCEIKLDLRMRDAETWEEIASYPLLIQHT
jgi:hypothetical protein